ncbi:hypothetical protein LTR85_007912 [Meristemomyces frigidus]|nr:hypothetical protein LTR85_007912 [Meristemomyces frigidus]
MAVGSFWDLINLPDKTDYDFLFHDPASPLYRRPKVPGSINKGPGRADRSVEAQAASPTLPGVSGGKTDTPSSEPYGAVPWKFLGTVAREQSSQPQPEQDAKRLPSALTKQDNAARFASGINASARMQEQGGRQ